MDITVILDTGGKSIEGLDKGALQADIEAEIQEFALRTNAKPPHRRTVSAPPGAQGEDQLIHWLVEVLKEPAMIGVYARTLVFALNELASSVSKIRNKSKPTPGGTEHAQPFAVRVSILGREILLPAATAMVKQFLEDALGSGGGREPS
jgi:hypothetical protein